MLCCVLTPDSVLSSNLIPNSACVTKSPSQHYEDFCLLTFRRAEEADSFKDSLPTGVIFDFTLITRKIIFFYFDLFHLPHCRCTALLLYLITDIHTEQDSPGRVIGPSPSQNTTNIRGKHSRPQQDSNPRSQQSSCRRPTPLTARPPGSA